MGVQQCGTHLGIVSHDAIRGQHGTNPAEGRHFRHTATGSKLHIYINIYLHIYIYIYIYIYMGVWVVPLGIHRILYGFGYVPKSYKAAAAE